MIDLSAVREQWISERPKYVKLRKYVETTLKQLTRHHGVACTVESREKDVASFCKKIMLKGYQRPMEEMTDKAGARVVVTHANQVAAVRSIIESAFYIHTAEDKASALGADQLGYLGVHYIVSVRTEQITDYNSTIADLVCEVQVNTQAQRLWADLAHDLSYKRIQEGIGPAERMINRLVALVEIIDSESSRAKDVIEAQPGFEEAMVLSALEQSYFRLSGRTFNREFSLDIIRRLLPTLSKDELARFSPRMEEFVAQHNQKLERIFADYENDERSSPLLFQPESLLIFERIEETPYVLKDQWSESLPLPLLEDLGLVWGKSI